MFSRRTMLRTGALLGLAGAIGPRIAYARAATDRRALVVVLRGAADGMALAAPIGDPGFTQHRARWSEEYAQAQKLDTTFALHKALPHVGKLYNAGEALVAHALATSYRERSHFAGQNLLETGGAKAYALRDGFLNRLLGLIPQGDFRALALAEAVPLALRGGNKVGSYAPSNLPDASALLTERVADLYANDRQLAALWSNARELQAMVGDTQATNLQRASEAGALAAKLMGEANGARLVMLDLSGWDSHASQISMLGKSFGSLDALVAAFHRGIGAAWRDTMVLVVTEFGRTAAINGTGGTDHGTASAALLLGGAVRGGRVVTDWPGLAPAQLYEGRDLRPTASLEAFMTGALADHFAVDPARAMAVMFPGRVTRAMDGLIRV